MVNEETAISFFLLAGTLFALLLVAGFMIYIIASRKKISDQKQMVLSAEINTQEKIQSVLSRELHDDLGANISLVKLTISSLKLDKSLNSKQIATINQSIETLDESIKSIRYFSHRLSPFGLGSNNNLVESIQNLRSLYAYNSEILFNINIYTDYINLGADKNLNLYRIIQELIQNSIKHADCSEIYLTINFENDSLKIVYEDNGTFKETNNNEIKGIGIDNIKTRVFYLKGNIEFINHKNLTVKINIPHGG